MNAVYDVSIVIGGCVAVSTVVFTSAVLLWAFRNWRKY